MAGRNDEQIGKMRGPIQDILSLLANVEKIEFEQFSMELGDLELWVPAGNAISRAVTRAVNNGMPSMVKEKPSVLYNETYAPPFEKFPGSIHEVRLGATKKTVAAEEVLSSSGDRTRRHLSTLISLQSICRYLQWISLT